MDEWRHFAELANPDGWFWQTDPEHRFVWLSDSFESIAGVSPELLLGKSRTDLFKDSVTQREWESHLVVLKNREPFRNFVFKPTTKSDGTWASISGAPIWDASGAFQGYRGVGNVVTEMIDPADQVAALSTIIDELNATVAIWDRADRLIYVNDAFKRYNLPILDVIAQPISYEHYLREGLAAGLFPEQIGREEAFIQSRLAQYNDPGPPQEVTRADGHVFQITQQRLSNGMTFTFGVDVTEQRHLARELKLTLDRFNDFAEVSADWLWEQDADLRFTSVSETNPHGDWVDMSHLIGKTRREVDLGEITEEQWAVHDRAVVNREPLMDWRVRHLTEDGQAKFVSIRARPVFNTKGEFAGYRGTGRDITEQTYLMRELENTRARLEQVLELTPIAVIMASNEGKIKYVNRGLEELLGVRREEVRGEPVKSLYSNPTDRDQVAEIVSRDGHLRNHETKMRTKSGLDLPVLLSAQPAPGDDGGLIGWAIDISQRKKSEQRLIDSQSRFQDFAEASSDWFWETDAQNKYTYFSGLMEKLTGFDADNMIGRDRRAFVASRANDDETLRNHLDDTDALRPFRDVRMKFERGDGGTSWFSLSGRPSFDESGQFIGYRGTGEDVTAQVDLETAAGEALDNARAANMAKSEFLSSMSHELRTPLNSILGFSQLLRLDSERPLSPDQTEGVEQIFKAGSHLLELINQVLDLSRIEQGHMSVSIEDINPAEVLGECLSLVELQARERAISVEHSGLEMLSLPLIRADRVRLKQVFLNLLMNAVKYNTTGTRIGLHYAFGNDRSLRFEIWDDGPGIPEDKRPDIFKPFNRLGMEALEVEGTGIGLTISRELVGLMDGGLGFQESREGGACFWFELPLSEAKAVPETVDPPPNDVEPPALTMSHRKVLYIEDNPANLMLINRIINQLGDAELLSAHTAELGIVMIRAERPDLVLMDINLPGASGIDTMRQLRASSDTADIPVVAISGATMPDDLKRASLAGFAHYLTKPIDVSEALEVIGEVLESSVNQSGRHRP